MSKGRRTVGIKKRNTAVQAVEKVLSLSSSLERKAIFKQKLRLALRKSWYLDFTLGL